MQQFDVRLALMLAIAAAGPAAAQTQGDEERAVLATVQRLFDTMKSKDTATMLTLFAPNARLSGMRIRRADSTVFLQSQAAQDFAAAAARDTRIWQERAFEPQVRVSGTLATVWATYDFHYGVTPWSCGIDAVQLLKSGGSWKIVSIADTYQTVGCPARTPPQP